LEKSGIRPKKKMMTRGEKTTGREKGKTGKRLLSHESWIWGLNERGRPNLKKNEKNTGNTQFGKKRDTPSQRSGGF